MKNIKKYRKILQNNWWVLSDLEEILYMCETLTKEEFGLNLYPNKLEVVSYEQMIDAYTSNGLPITYKHWSFGKKYIQEMENYKRGNPLAYELVINSNPCINYLLENNNMTMQLLVIAHAACGHNHFFKNNYMFKEFTNADFILDYLKFARDYIEKCEERYGVNEVEKIIDSAHALYFMGLDKFPKKKRNVNEETMILKEKLKWLEKNYDHVMDVTTRNIPPSNENKNTDANLRNIVENKYFEPYDMENILYFVEKKSPVLKEWQREIVRIVRNMAQYFYPVVLTKTMNEGFASFIHYLTFEKLWEYKIIDDGKYLEFIDYHTAVLKQPYYNEDGIVYWNPYYIGFNIFMDIKRMCEEPDEEDYEFKPEICGKNWKDVILNIVENYRDDSFIMDFLSPKLIRKMKIFVIRDSQENEKYYEVTNIHNERGYDEIRKYFAQKYSPVNYFPEINVKGVHSKNHTLYLEYKKYLNMELSKDASKALKHLKKLWGYDVELLYINEEGKIVNRRTF